MRDAQSKQSAKNYFQKLFRSALADLNNLYGFWSSDESKTSYIPDMMLTKVVQQLREYEARNYLISSYLTILLHDTALWKLMLPNPDVA